MKAGYLAATAILLCAFSGGAWSGEAEKEVPKPRDQETRLKELERRIQLLERALVEKDARIGELNQKVDTLTKTLEARTQQAPQTPQAPQRQQQWGPQMQPGFPGFRFQLSPHQMEEFNRRLNEYFKRNLDDLFDPRVDPRGNDDMFRRPGGNWMDGWDMLQRRDRTMRRRPRLGVSVSDSNAELRHRFRNNVREGAFITRVVPDSAADDAGLIEGDCVIRFLNQPIRSSRDLITLCQTAPNGRHRIVIMRAGGEKTLHVTLAEPKAQPRELNQDNVRRDGNWLRRREQPMDQERQVVTEVHAGKLQFSEQIARAMDLSDAQRKKMQNVLTSAQKALNEEYGALVARGGQDALSRRELTRMVEKHALAAEKKLADTLTERQIRVWREQRERNQTLRVSRHEQMRSTTPRRKEVPPGGSEF